MAKNKLKSETFRNLLLITFGLTFIVAILVFFLYIPSNINYKDYWQTEKDSNGNFIRGEKYKKLKNEVADILINRVEQTLNIDLDSHIEFIDISTPITYLRYTGNKNGTMMGARPGKENMQAGIAHHQTPVKNLFLGGHWAELGGGVPICTKTAINAVLLILKKNKKQAFSLLANYMDNKIQLEQLHSSELICKYDNSWEN